MALIKVGDERNPNLGVYCPECGWDCTGVVVEVDEEHQTAQVHCQQCDGISHPAELLAERTDGQASVWERIEELTERLKKAELMLSECRRQNAMLHKAGTTPRLSGVSRG